MRCRPESERIQVRIGVNLGEVIIDGKDRYGEGVNIAARLQQLAEPGGIWVSGKVAREVEKKLSFDLEPMGDQAAQEHGRTDFSLSCCDRRVGARLAISQAAYPSSEASLAVLPFVNLSGDPEQDYFADGVVDDIITALSRFTSFAVIARNSSFVYKGRAVDVRQVARISASATFLRAACGELASGCGSPHSSSMAAPGRTFGRNISTGRWPTSSRSRIASRPTWR